MVRKTLSALLAVLVINLGILATGSDNKDKEAKFTEKVKTEITKLGTGTDAKIKLKLKDGTKLKGYVSDANAEQFTVTNAKTGVSTPVSYAQVQTAKGNNLSKGVIIGLGVLAFIIVISVLAASSK